MYQIIEANGKSTARIWPVPGTKYVSPHAIRRSSRHYRCAFNYIAIIGPFPLKIIRARIFNSNLFFVRHRVWRDDCQYFKMATSEVNSLGSIHNNLSSLFTLDRRTIFGKWKLLYLSRCLS
jgi:hypothetical protein